VILGMDTGSSHTSRLTQQALAERAAWLEGIFLSRDSPELNPKEREWRLLQCDHRRTLRAFGEVRLEGRRGLGGARCEVGDHVPTWWLAGHRTAPTGRPAGRPVGATDSAPRTRRQPKTNLPAPA
jgi:hypothetical protein